MQESGLRLLDSYVTVTGRTIRMCCKRRAKRTGCGSPRKAFSNRFNFLRCGVVIFPKLKQSMLEGECLRLISLRKLLRLTEFKSTS